MWPMSEYETYTEQDEDLSSSSERLSPFWQEALEEEQRDLAARDRRNEELLDYWQAIADEEEGEAA